MASSVPSWYVTLNKIRGTSEGGKSTINWGRKWNWAIQFRNAPAPFNEWFPAIDCKLVTFSLEKQDLAYGIGLIPMPKSFGLKSLSITFVDECQQPLSRFFHSWMKSAFTLEGGTLTHQQMSKQISIYYYDSKLDKIISGQYQVYPFGEINFEGSSESEVVTNSVEFVVTGVDKDLFDDAYTIIELSGI